MYRGAYGITMCNKKSINGSQLEKLKKVYSSHVTTMKIYREEAIGLKLPIMF